MPTESTTELGAFLDGYWEEEKGKVYFASIKEGVKETFKQYFPAWPLERSKVIRAMTVLAGQGYDVFFAPAVFEPDAPKPERDYVASVNCRWVDLDGNAPENWEVAAKEKGVPEPSTIVQSSMERQQHVYWMTERVRGSEGLGEAEGTNRALAAAFGADKSGWDLNQLLRVPGTINYGWRKEGEHKPWYTGQPVEVKLVKKSPSVIDQDSFSNLTNAERQILEKITITHIPDIAMVMAMGKWTEEMFTHFKMTPQESSDASPNKRSGSLQRLAYYAAENSFTDEQIYSILDDADRRWGKYINSHSKAGRDKILRDSIARARDKIGYLVGEDVTLAGIMGSSPITSPKFVYNYQEFLDSEFKVDWLLDGLIPAQGFGLIVGQPGVGKTRLGLQMAIEMAAGREHIINWENTTGPKKVFMLSLEMGGNPLSLFMRSFASEYEKDSLTLSRNFNVAPFGSELSFDRPEGQQLITNLMSEYNPDVLFVDSLQKSTSKPMTDEIAMKAMSSFVGSLRDRFGLAVYFVHHERKRPSDRQGGSGDLSDVYGSQMLSADIDFAVGLSKNGDFVNMSEYKNRLAARPSADILLMSEGIRFVKTSTNPEGIMEDGYNTGNEGNGPTITF